MEEFIPLSPGFHCYCWKIGCWSKQSPFSRLILVFLWLLFRLCWSCGSVLSPWCGRACALIYPFGDSWGFLDLSFVLLKIAFSLSSPLFSELWLASDQIQAFSLSSWSQLLLRISHLRMLDNRPSFFVQLTPSPQAVSLAHKAVLGTSPSKECLSLPEVLFRSF